MRIVLTGILALAASACAASGFSGTAYVTAGLVDLKATTPTVEECAEAVRTATKIPDPSSLGQIVQRAGPQPDGLVGLCVGPDGRTYLIAPNEIRPGPTVMFER